MISYFSNRSPSFLKKKIRLDPLPSLPPSFPRPSSIKRQSLLFPFCSAGSVGRCESRARRRRWRLQPSAPERRRHRPHPPIRCHPTAHVTRSRAAAASLLRSSSLNASSRRCERSSPAEEHKDLFVCSMSVWCER